MLGWYLFFALLLVMLAVIFDFNFGRLLGWRETWLYRDDYRLVGGKSYNGIITYYVLFVPVWRKGFHHSTTFFDD